MLPQGVTGPSWSTLPGVGTIKPSRASCAEFGTSITDLLDDYHTDAPKRLAGIGRVLGWINRNRKLTVWLSLLGIFACRVASQKRLIIVGIRGHVLWMHSLGNLSDSLHKEESRKIRDIPNSPYQHLGTSRHAGKDSATPEHQATEQLGWQKHKTSFL